MHPTERLPLEVWTYIISLCTPLDFIHLLSADQTFARFMQNLSCDEWLHIVSQMWKSLHCNVGMWTEDQGFKDDTLWITIPSNLSKFDRFEQRFRLLKYLLTIHQTQQNAIESMLEGSVYLRECPKYPSIPFIMNCAQDLYLNRLHGSDILKHLQYTLSIVLPLDFLNLLLNFSHRLALKQPYVPWNFRSTNSTFLFFGPEDTWKHFRLLNPEEYIDSDLLNGEHPSNVLYNRRSSKLNAEWKDNPRKLLVISQSSSGDRLVMDVTHPDSCTYGWIYAHSSHPLVFNTCNPQFLDFSITDLLFRVTNNDQMKLKTSWFHNVFDKPNLDHGSLFNC